MSTQNHLKTSCSSSLHGKLKLRLGEFGCSKATQITSKREGDLISCPNHIHFHVCALMRPAGPVPGVVSKVMRKRAACGGRKGGGGTCEPCGARESFRPLATGKAYSNSWNPDGDQQKTGTKQQNPSQQQRASPKERKITPSHITLFKRYSPIKDP